MAAQQEIRRYVDVDDTLYDRGEKLRDIGLKMGKIKPWSYKDRPVPTQHAEHGPVKGLIISPLELVSLVAHSRRNLLPGVDEDLYEATKTGKVKVTTGRSNKKPWVNMSRRQFKRGGIDKHISTDYYKAGESGTESKIDSIVLDLESDGLTFDDVEVEYYDDDPRTGLTIARRLPRVKVFIIEYEKTIQLAPKSELLAQPNLHIVQNIGQGIRR